MKAQTTIKKLQIRTAIIWVSVIIAVTILLRGLEQNHSVGLILLIGAGFHLTLQSTLSNRLFAREGSE
ncbi:MAG: hypothetical protein JXQ90_05905 [Cyclobacteriaceae bacterium]